jgi:ammonia channel protein AmtB
MSRVVFRCFGYFPIGAVPWKKSTLAIVPSESEAFAVNGTVAGAVKVAPLAGLVRLTAGGAFTRMVTAALAALEP